MKFLIVVLAIAMVIQSSLANTLRLKRSSDVEEGLMEYLKISKDLVYAVENGIKGTLKEMPTTEAYHSYKTELEAMQKDIEDFHKTPGNCFAKTFSIMFEFVAFVMEHAADGATEEAKHVFALLEKYGGDEIDKEFAEWQEKYSDKKMDPKIHKMTAEEALEATKPFFAEVC